LSGSSSPSAAAHVEAAAATSSFGPAEAQVANDNRIMLSMNFALAVFKEELMTLSPIDDRVVPFWRRYGES
jgi:alpha-glucuronidase